MMFKVDNSAYQGHSQQMASQVIAIGIGKYLKNLYHGIDMFDHDTFACYAVVPCLFFFC
jgi:hypothetical protein